MDELRARPGEWVRHGRFSARIEPEALMRPRPPEVWSHLVAFVRERLAERQADPAVLWPALDGLAAEVAGQREAYAGAPYDAVIDVETAMWHLAAIWRDDPAFQELLGREYDRLYFDWERLGIPLPAREAWIREWTP